MRFGSRVPSEEVPVRLGYIPKGIESELIEKPRENAVQGLGKEKPMHLKRSHVQKMQNIYHRTKKIEKCQKEITWENKNVWGLIDG